jgi:hypothetical protein
MSRKLRDWFLVLTCSLAAILMLGLVGCGSTEPAEEEAAAEEDMAEHDMSDMEDADGAPRISFANVSEGDEVTSPVQISFAAENFTIEPVGEGEIHEGAGHYHIGINTHCLPPGEIIPQAAPWVHFGDGSSTIEVQLEPGPAHLSVQIGDGEHRTLDEEGLCAMINLTVVEADAAEGDA